MRVLSVKFKKGLVLFKFIGQHPSKLFVRTLVSFPANIVEQGTLATPSIDLRIKDLANVIILFTVNNDWRRWILASVQNSVQCKGFELGNMENRMDGAVFLWKLKGECNWRGFSDDFERTKFLLSKLSCRSCHFDVLGVDHDLVTNVPIWMRE